VRGQWDDVFFPDESKLVKMFTFCVRIMKVGGLICKGNHDMFKNLSSNEIAGEFVGTV
jgi:hypothetical protein